MPFSTNLQLYIQYLSVDQLYKRQLAELPIILDSFYTSIITGRVGMEVGSGGEPQSG